MSLLPQLYSRLTEYTPATVLPVAIVTYLCLLLISRVDVGGVKFSMFVVLVGVIFQWYGLRKWLPLGVELGIVKDNSLPVGNDAKKRRPSYTMMVGRMIRRLSTVQEQEEDIEEEEEEEEEERENGGVAMSSIHRRRLLELLIEQEAEIRHFEVKKLRQVILCLIVLAVLCAASV
ncbi:PREDICTED: uncharacterized protein LOC109590141 [Amphimedon queenslandica]|uniref:Uncharacterized protein n=1 Tax=Amphimedon queenslandica TaxID=400682 RepID=A0A1X7T3E4_AMPQE|nr:PREDICTED: uncharacterized protein LOC109590141 [Amphimedon queenslandica]|eukprot:XP_019861629.1 PREDICTED: uncharacterized protein LOC109590141 [Amphimedon queenslandica]